jgi:hypothetical protein
MRKDEGGTPETDGCETPLVDRLRMVPEDYRTSREIQWDSRGVPTGHQFIPVGYLMHTAANRIQALERDLNTTAAQLGDYVACMAQRDEAVECLRRFAHIDLCTGSDLWAIDTALCEKARSFLAHLDGGK